MKETMKLARQIIWRYRHETPLGNQPHMIAHEADEAIERIDQALAKQEQSVSVGEPDLIECGNCHEGLSDMEHVCKKCLGAGWVNNPKQEQGEPVIYGGHTASEMASAILASSQPKQEQGEPVAMRYDFDGYGYKYIDSGSGSDWQTRIKDAEPLYTAQQQRTWVGLTDEDKDTADLVEAEVEQDWIDGYLGGLKDAEAKLKEKNHD